MSLDWIRPDWPASSSIVAGSTLRTGGHSANEFSSLNLATHVGDEPWQVSRNRALFFEECDLPSEPMWLNQVHRPDVLSDESVDDGAAADARITRMSGVVCAVLTADCLPVLICTTDGSEVAAAHAGWRGLCLGVLEATAAEFRAAPSSLQAWLGPAISQDAFEVGPEVREQFMAADERAELCFEANSAGRWQADLYGLARQRLARAGIDRVFGGDRCTFGEPEAFFSYRRDGECGRMATFIFRRSA